MIDSYSKHSLPQCCCCCCLIWPPTLWCPTSTWSSWTWPTILAVAIVSGSLEVIGESSPNNKTCGLKQCMWNLLCCRDHMGEHEHSERKGNAAIPAARSSRGFQEDSRLLLQPLDCNWKPQARTANQPLEPSETIKKTQNHKQTSPPKKNQKTYFNTKFA